MHAMSSIKHGNETWLISTTITNTKALIGSQLIKKENYKMYGVLYGTPWFVNGRDWAFSDIWAKSMVCSNSSI